VGSVHVRHGNVAQEKKRGRVFERMACYRKNMYESKDLFQLICDS
jgi:hypothetical protein